MFLRTLIALTALVALSACGRTPTEPVCIKRIIQDTAWSADRTTYRVFTVTSTYCGK